MATIRTPRHILITQKGQKVEQETSNFPPKVPKVIDYTHTIRVIQVGLCNHERSQQNLKEHYEKQLREKENQIRSMRDTIASKGRQRVQEDEQMSHLSDRSKINQSIMEELNSSSSKTTDPNHCFYEIKINAEKQFKGGCSRMLSSRSLATSTVSQSGKQNKFMEDLSKQLKDTENSLRNITNTLKPRKKYNFYKKECQKNSDGKENNHSLISDVKSLKDENSDFGLNMENQILNCLDFSQSKLNENESLELSLIEEQQKVCQEKEELKEYYAQIKNYADIISSDRSINLKIKEHSRRLNSLLEIEEEDLETFQEIEKISEGNRSIFCEGEDSLLDD